MTISRLILILSWVMFVCSASGVVTWLLDWYSVNPFGSLLMAIASVFFIKMANIMVAKESQK